MLSDHDEMFLVLAAAAVIGFLYGQWHAGRTIRAIHRKHFPDRPDGDG